MQEIGQFLQEHKTDYKPSIVSLFYPKGKFLIAPELIDQFWTLYCENYVDHKLGLAENQITAHIPVLVDVDLKKETSDASTGLYNMKHVQRLVQMYQKVLKEIVTGISDENLWCFLLEKPSYILKKGDKTFLKNGFHLHFPYLFLSRYDQEHHLLPRIRIECKRLAPSEFPSSVVTPDTYIDKAYCKGQGIPWLLYGSRKDDTQSPYQVTTVFDPDGKPVDEWKRQLLDYNIYTMDRKKINLDLGNMETHLPRIFSIIPNGRDEYIFDVSTDIKMIPSNIHGLKNKKMTIIHTTESTEEISSQVEKLIPLLSMERATDYNDWIQVGWTLFNIFDGSDEGYEHWITFSKKCPASFDEGVCHSEWNKMTKKEITIGTLKFMARMDNYEKYTEISKEFARPFLEKCAKLDCTHYDLAQALFQKYESEFVCASITNKVWYQFQDHIWKRIEEGNSLREKLSNEVVKDYEFFANEIVKKISICDSEEEAAVHKNRLKGIKKLLRNLKNSPFKTNVMKEAMEVFYQEGFLQKLDSNPYLIAFQNGVFDLLQHRFRPGRPDDYISIKMPIHYNEDLTHDHDRIKDINEYFEKIFPDKTVRDYFLDISSEVFVGFNSHKIVQVWTGEGDNGKSVTQALFEKMLGPYNIKLPTSLITGKRTQSSAACPELVRAGNGARFAMLQEPDAKDVINVGMLKELSGNDTFFARGLYKEGAEITPMFKLALICNETPKLPYNDKAAWNRIRVIPFESVFTSNAPETVEEQLALKRFPKDPHFSDKIPRMVEAFAWFLLERYHVKPRVLKEPPKVMFATQSYQKKNDVFQQYIDELIIHKEGTSILLNDMYATFKDWFRESIPHGSLPTKQEVGDYFGKIWGDGIAIEGNKRWEGHTLRGDFVADM